MRVALAAVLLIALASGCTEPTGPPPGSGTSTSSIPSPTSTAPPVHADPVHLFFDFGGETEGPGDLSGWSLQADVPDDPNRPGQKVAWNVTACEDAGWEGHVHIQAHPVHSACFTLDGRQSDGTVWISRSIPVTRGASYVANVSVQAWGTESFNTIADLVLRLGVMGAVSEQDFMSAQDTQHGAIRSPLDVAAGWTSYSLEWTTGPVASDHLVLDIGISAIWATEMTRYLDALTVDLVPAQG